MAEIKRMRGTSSSTGATVGNSHLIYPGQLLPSLAANYLNYPTAVYPCGLVLK